MSRLRKQSRKVIPVLIIASILFLLYYVGPAGALNLKLDLKTDKEVTKGEIINLTLNADILSTDPSLEKIILLVNNNTCEFTIDGEKINDCPFGKITKTSTEEFFDGYGYGINTVVNYSVNVCSSKLDFGQNNIQVRVESNSSETFTTNTQKVEVTSIDELLTIIQGELEETEALIKEAKKTVDKKTKKDILDDLQDDLEDIEEDIIEEYRSGVKNKDIDDIKDSIEEIDDEAKDLKQIIKKIDKKGVFKNSDKLKQKSELIIGELEKMKRAAFGAAECLPLDFDKIRRDMSDTQKLIDEAKKEVDKKSRKNILDDLEDDLRDIEKEILKRAERIISSEKKDWDYIEDAIEEVEDEIGDLEQIIDKINKRGSFKNSEELKRQSEILIEDLKGFSDIFFNL